MGPINGRNLDYVSYFPLMEYVNRIKLSNNVKEHLKEIDEKFYKYLDTLSKYDAYSVTYYLLDQQKKELIYSSKLEKHNIEHKILLDESLFFGKEEISHNKIKELHKLAGDLEVQEDYRTVPVRVSSIDKNMVEIIYWRGVNEEDVEHFMEDFLTFYKDSSSSDIMSNPYIKSALVTLLFIRIHPFTDGNGRTARVLQNIKFTEAINKIYGLNLRLCPINLSQSILLNQLTYVRRLDQIYFDLKHNSNDEINNFLNFILDMMEEQLYYNMNKIPKLSNAFKNISELKKTDTSDIPKYVTKIKKLTNIRKEEKI